MDHIALDASDAIELIEILEYFIETIDRTEQRLAGRLFENRRRDEIEDLRADLTRLVESLNQSPLTP